MYIYITYSVQILQVIECSCPCSLPAWFSIAQLSALVARLPTSIVSEYSSSWLFAKCPFIRRSYRYNEIHEWLYYWQAQDTWSAAHTYTCCAHVRYCFARRGGLGVIYKDKGQLFCSGISICSRTQTATIFACQLLPLNSTHPLTIIHPRKHGSLCFSSTFWPLREEGNA